MSDRSKLQAASAPPSIGATALSILGGLPCFVVVTQGPAHTIEIANDAFSRLVGDRPLVGLQALEALPEIAAMGIPSLLDRVYATGKPYARSGVRVNFRPPGQGPTGLRYVDVSYQPRRASDGSVTGVIVSGFDFTTHKQGQIRLRQLRESLRSQVEEHQYVVENSLDIVCSMARNGTIVAANRRMSDILLYEKSELIGRDSYSLVHPDDIEKTRAARNEMLSSGVLHSFENRLIRKDGVAVPLQWSTIWSPKRQATHSTARDLTERYRIEEEVRRAQKMEALGQLTGGIAHDFNNLLTVISGNAELLANEALPPRDRPSLVAEISQAAERGADLTQHLLSFAQRQPLKPSYVKVEEVICELIPLLRRAVQASIDIRTDLDSGGFSVLVDRALLESAVLNLVVNARDAMPRGGVVTIKTEVRGAEENEAPLAIGQDVVTITIADDGPGMAADVLSRAFEPFFTTKGPGQGSGLGLAMVYGFAQQSGGVAKIKTVLGQGTSVSMVLPAVVGMSADAIDKVSASSRRSVLVVKTDRQRVQLVFARLLSLGHEVTQVRSAEDARSVLAGRKKTDILISDIELAGGFSGVELAKDALAQFPHLKAILVGTAQELIDTPMPADERFCLLPYPYSRKQLAACINRLTSQAGGKK